MSFAAGTVEVPNLVGRSLRRAEAALEQAGLRIDAPPGAGTVSGQQPGGAELVAPGTTVTVSLSLPGIRVPNILGMTAAEAAAVLEPLGLVLDTTGDGRRVTKQQPVASTRATRGDVVLATSPDWTSSWSTTGSTGDCRGAVVLAALGAAVSAQSPGQARRRAGTTT